MDKYYRVPKPKQKQSSLDDVRVTKQTPVRNYVRFAIKQFLKENKDTITFRAMGEAVSKMTTIVEIVRHRVKGIYVVTLITSNIMEDVYEPLEEGLDRLVFTKRVVELQMTMTTKKPEGIEIQGSISEPIPDDQVLGMYYYIKKEDEEQLEDNIAYPGFGYRGNGELRGNPLENPDEGAEQAQERMEGFRRGREGFRGRGGFPMRGGRGGQRGMMMGFRGGRNRLTQARRQEFYQRQMMNRGRFAIGYYGQRGRGQEAAVRRVTRVPIGAREQRMREEYKEYESRRGRGRLTGMNDPLD
eukprot:403340429